MKFLLALFLILSLFAVSSDAGVYRNGVKPLAKVSKKLGKKSGHGVKHLGHAVKKILY